MNWMRIKYRKKKIDLSPYFYRIYYSLIDEHGIAPQFRDRLYKERELLLLKLKYLRTNEDVIINQIRRIERQLNDMQDDKEPPSVQRQIAVINTFFSISLRMQDLSVSEFFHYRKRYDESVKELNKKQQKHG